MQYEGAADICFGVMPLSGAPESADGAWLDDGERERLASMSGPIRPREFLGGRYLARSMAARLLGVRESAIRIEAEEGGRPSVAGPERLCMGLTHTRDYAACALSARAVGLDLEELGLKGDLKAVENFAFSASEKAFVAGHGGGLDRESRFFAIWTLKEAYVKRLGLGVGAIKRAPSFALGPGREISAAGGEDCGYSSFALGELIIGALAFGAPPGFDGDAAARGGSKPILAVDPRFAPPPALEPRLLFGRPLFG